MCSSCSSLPWIIGIIGGLWPAKGGPALVPIVEALVEPGDTVGNGEGREVVVSIVAATEWNSLSELAILFTLFLLASASSSSSRSLASSSCRLVLRGALPGYTHVSPAFWQFLQMGDCLGHLFLSLRHLEQEYDSCFLISPSFIVNTAVHVS